VRPCAVGQRLVDLCVCVASGCVILNGRAPGGQEGRPTFVGFDGLVSSVIDYGVVSRSMWPFVGRFVVTLHPGTLTITGC